MIPDGRAGDPGPVGRPGTRNGDDVGPHHRDPDAMRDQGPGRARRVVA